MDVPVSITRKPGKNCSYELTRMTNMMIQLSESKMSHMKKKNRKVRDLRRDYIVVYHLVSDDFFLTWSEKKLLADLLWLTFFFSN